MCALVARPAQLRSVAPVGLPYHLKLALAVQTTSALRTISPYSVFNGPRLTAAAKLIAPPGALAGRTAGPRTRRPDPRAALRRPAPARLGRQVS